MHCAVNDASYLDCFSFDYIKDKIVFNYQHPVSDSFQPAIFRDHAQFRDIGQLGNSVVKFFKQCSCRTRSVSGNIVENIIQVYDCRLQIPNLKGFAQFIFALSLLKSSS